MHQIKYFVSLVSFIALSFFASNSFADLQTCPALSDIHHECQTYNKATWCDWVTYQRGWEGDNDYSTDPTVHVTGFIKVVWYPGFHQVNCIYQASNAKTVTLIPTLFGVTNPTSGPWHASKPGENSLCTLLDQCNFTYN